MPLKVMTIVGTRPEIIKLSRVMSELDKHMQHVLVHTGQNYDYELNELFFQELGVRKPDHFLNAVGETVAETIGKVIASADAVMAEEKPDALLILGDTNSCLAVIAAKRRKIPIFHMEAGNRCFDLRVPEEINRKIVDHISDINMPYTEHARRYLLREGIKPDTIIKTGSPQKEILSYYMPKIDASDVLERLQLKPAEYLLVSIHREENVDSEDNFQKLMNSLNAVASTYERTVIVSTHPRTRRRIDALGDYTFDKRIKFMKPFGLFDYVKMQKHAFCVVSDSGTITEESSMLNIPAVTIRQAHERPEGMDEGTLIMCGLEADEVMQAISVVRAQQTAGGRPFRFVADYDVDNVSKKVVRIIMSYTDYINRTVWFK
jgi:UDP-N-acetylglucosamine 2-epimerase (non-hydrolysing)